MQVWSLIMQILCLKWQKLRKNWWTPKIKSQYWKYSWNPHQIWIKLKHRPLWKYFRKWVYPIAGSTMLCLWIQQKLESKQVFNSCSVSWKLIFFWRYFSKVVFKHDWPKPLVLKVAFFQKVWCIFLIAQKMCWKLSWKRDFEIAFCLESAD